MIGEGPSTQVSATPVGPPSTPMNVVAKPGSKAIDLTWDKPVSDGGSDLTTYTIVVEAEFGWRRVVGDDGVGDDDQTHDHGI